MDQDNPRGPYKQYERDLTKKMSRTTAWRKRKSAQIGAERQTSSSDDEKVSITEDEHDPIQSHETMDKDADDETRENIGSNRSSISQNPQKFSKATMEKDANIVTMETTEEFNNIGADSSESELEECISDDDGDDYVDSDGIEEIYNELMNCEDDAEIDILQSLNVEDRDFLHESSFIRRKESELILLALAIRHHLPDIGLTNLINTIDCHLPFKKYISKYHFLKSFPLLNFKEYYFCEECDEISTFENNEYGCCGYCKKLYRMKFLHRKGQFFVSISLKEQLEELVHSDLFDKMRKTCEESDVINSKVYRRLKQQKVIANDDITLQCNVDGVSLSNSSKASLWPILVTVNELPYRIRKNNVLICGLWYSEKKPRMNMYLKPFVEELKELNIHGIMRQLDQTNSTTIKIHTLLFTVDSVARPLIQNMKQYNGKYGCSYCLQKGSRIRMGGGFSRIYLYSNINLRSSRDYKIQVKLAIENEKSIKGIKGPSVLSLIPGMNVMFGCPPDYLHCCLLGVIKLFVTAWFDATNKDREFYIGRKKNNSMKDYYRFNLRQK